MELLIYIYPWDSLSYPKAVLCGITSYPGLPVVFNVRMLKNMEGLGMSVLGIHTFILQVKKGGGLSINSTVMLTQMNEKMAQLILHEYSILSLNRGSRSLQNLVAISQRSWRPLLTLKAGCIMAKIGYSIQGLVAKVKDTVANSYRRLSFNCKYFLRLQLIDSQT